MSVSSAYPYSIPRRGSRALAVMSCLNLAAVLSVGWMLAYPSEDWWVGMPLVYAPKVPFLVPAALLLIWSGLIRSRCWIINLAAALVVLGPIMGFVVPVSKWSRGPISPQRSDVRVVSCNIQGFEPSFPLVVAEVLGCSPDIVAFQEVRGDDHPLLAKAFGDWHVARHDYFWIGSKHPLRFIRAIESPDFQRSAGLLVEVDLPTGTVLVGNLHLMTPRRSLSELTWSGMFNGENQVAIKEHQRLRELEVQSVRTAIDECRGGLPLLLLGDFNTPSSSSLYLRWWSDLQNAYDAAGWGYGYTIPCTAQRFWPANTPWARIDHILGSSDWDVLECRVGEDAGSDHRMIAALLRPLTASPDAPPFAAPDADSNAPAGRAGRVDGVE